MREDTQSKEFHPCSNTFLIAVREVGQFNINAIMTVVAGIGQKFWSFAHMHAYVYGVPHIKIALCHIWL